MRFKHIAAGFTVAGMIVAGIGTTIAADKTDSTEVAKKEKTSPRIDRIDGILDKLNLSPDQRTKVNDIMSNAATQFRDARAGAKKGGDRTAMRAKVKQVMLDTREKLQQVLTADQKAQLKAQLKEARQGADRPRRLRGGATTKPVT